MPFPCRSLLTLATTFLPLAVQAEPVDFVREVRPIFERYCYECHAGEEHSSGLRLDIRSAALRGGDGHAPNIVPGRSAESPLFRFVSGADPDLRMPPEGESLSAEEIATVKNWIDAGAPWPDGVDLAVLPDKRDHWSFRPLHSDTPEELRSVRGIDPLIDHQLAAAGLQRSLRADRRTLIRRLAFVLHGLPPSPEEVEAFVRSEDPLAWERLVDRYLASPRYGERWARHWLDVIAFGETHGFEVNTPRENAWPYRDYVIQAFNNDIPYWQFIREQLAGDASGVDAATGMLVARAALLPGQTGKDEESIAMARQDELNEMVSITGGAFLGLTLHCARCHDHKFDPVSQVDYYSLQAIFAGVRHGERLLRSAVANRQDDAYRLSFQQEFARTSHQLARLDPIADVSEAPKKQRPPVNSHRNIERFAPVVTGRLRFTILATADSSRYEPCIDELEVYSVDGVNVALADRGTKPTASSVFGGPKHRLEHLNDGRHGNDRSWISKTRGEGWVELEFPQPVTIEAVIWGRDRLGKYRDRMPVEYRIEIENGDGGWTLVSSSRDRGASGEPAGNPVLFSQLSQLEARLVATSAEPMVYAGRFEQPAPSYRLHRGEAMQRREEVPPAAVAAIGPALVLDQETPEQQRRLALAEWLSDPANPLPARVLVNRLWQHHFGEGLVDTPNDFGRNGARPTHPALLDWLAEELIRSNGSIKHVQRLIVTSETFQQSSAPASEGMTVDAQCRLLWRYPPRRVEAEVLRDSLLAVAGTLDLRMEGPGFSVFAPNSNYVRVYDPKQEFGPEEWRRAIYMTKVRVAQDATFGAFDCPDAGQSQSRRPRSTTALQALNLFNSEFVLQQSEQFADRVRRETGDDRRAQVERAFALAVQRGPTEEELRVCVALTEAQGLPALCRVLFNLNEFLFVP